MAEFVINVSEPSKPNAVEDVVTTLPNSVITVDVLSNDFLGVEPTVITIEIPPINGVAVLVGTDIEYTPGNNYIGEDTIYYRITDSNGDYDISKLTITINNVN